MRYFEKLIHAKVKKKELEYLNELDKKLQYRCWILRGKKKWSLADLLNKTHFVIFAVLYRPKLLERELDWFYKGYKRNK